MDETHREKTQDDRLNPKYIYNPIKCQLSKNLKRDYHIVKKKRLSHCKKRTMVSPNCMMSTRNAIQM